MAATLRQLLIQRAARLQEAPALATEAWGLLSYTQLRNRVEGVALGLMALDLPIGTTVRPGGLVPWDWVVELAATCCGLRWDPSGQPVPVALLGGSAFNDEGGRQPYHDREDGVEPETPCFPGWTHGTWLAQLQRLNRILGWDHRTAVCVPPAALGTAEGRVAAWSALFAGAQLRLEEPSPQRRWWGRPRPADPPWDPAPFSGLL